MFMFRIRGSTVESTEDMGHFSHGFVTPLGRAVPAAFLEKSVLVGSYRNSLSLCLSACLSVCVYVFLFCVLLSNKPMDANP